MNRLIPLFLLLITCRTSHGYSLFPVHDPATLMGETADTEISMARFRATTWRPYGLPGITAGELSSSWRLGVYRGMIGVETQNWGVIQGRSLRLRLSRESVGGMQGGIEGRWRSLTGGGGKPGLEALLGGGGDLHLGIRYRIWEGGPHRERAAEATGIMGLTIIKEPMTLLLYRGLGAPAEIEEGVAVSWSAPPMRLTLLAGTAPWQTLKLQFRRSHWGVVLHSRFHTWLGVSYGASFVVF